MSLFRPKEERRLLPRWQDSVRAVHGPEFLSVKGGDAGKAKLPPRSYAQRAEFSTSKGIGTAAELLSAAMLAKNTEDAAEAARFIVENEGVAPRSLVEAAQAVLAGKSPFPTPAQQQGKYISTIRHLLRLVPDNPLLWSDLARHHASRGNRDHALRCMKTAQALAPNHRWMLRAYARFLVHQNDPIAAHKLLATHPRTRSDPWLIAAELACAQVAGRKPVYWRQANDMVRAESLAPLHLSELATAVAMMELEAGARKRARKLVHTGLLAPTENTLAQVSWATENKHLGEDLAPLDRVVRRTKDAFEADFQLTLREGYLLDAYRAGLEWCRDEPFAARPRVGLAFVASMLDDHDTPREMADLVRQIDGRDDPTLELNATFALLSSGKLDRNSSVEELARIKRQLVARGEQANGNSYHAVANLGLWHYRFGDQEVGFETYLAAIEVAQKHHRLEAAATAAIFAAREAVLAAHPRAGEMLSTARALVTRTKAKALEFYLKKVEAAFKEPARVSQIFAPGSAADFLETRVPEQPALRVEKKADGGLRVWVPERG